VCGDALDLRHLDDRHQRTLSTSPRFVQTRKATAIPHPRHSRFERAHARIPGALAVTVAAAGPRQLALVPLSAQVLGWFSSSRCETRCEEPEPMIDEWRWCLRTCCTGHHRAALRDQGTRMFASASAGDIDRCRARKEGPHCPPIGLRTGWQCRLFARLNKNWFVVVLDERSLNYEAMSIPRTWLTMKIR
jgi:hypothetical protein